MDYKFNLKELEEFVDERILYDSAAQDMAELKRFRDRYERMIKIYEQSDHHKALQMVRMMKKVITEFANEIIKVNSNS